MTLIASFFVKGTPLMLGDLLLSNDRDLVNMEVLNIPGTKSLLKADIFHGKIVPCGLKQKIVLIGGNVAVAWAGSRYIAKQVIQEIIDFRLSGSLTRKDLEEYLEKKKGTAEFEEIGLIIHLFDDGKFHKIVWGSSIKYECSIYGSVDIVGSGCNYLIGELEKRQGYLKGLASSYRGVLWFLCGLTSELVAMSFFENKSLRRLFGGGYESVLLTDNGFQKLDNATYYYWSAVIDRKENSGKVDIANNVDVFHFSYVDEILFIEHLYFVPDNASVENIKLGKHYVYVIDPIHKEHTHREVAKYINRPIKSSVITHFCEVIDMQKPNNGDSKFIINIDAPESPNVRLSRTQTSVNFEFRRSLIEMFKSEVAKIIDNNNPVEFYEL